MPTQVSLMLVRSRHLFLEQWTVQLGCPPHGHGFGTTVWVHPTPQIDLNTVLRGEGKGE